MNNMGEKNSSRQSAAITLYWLLLVLTIAGVVFTFLPQDSSFYLDEAYRVVFASAGIFLVCLWFVYRKFSRRVFKLEFANRTLEDQNFKSG